uniref:non-specific serine/threonine protein kinase n=1 Tax=Dermatophagoides pteronyssinus TaxID=6956 RepID=A0A6P6XVH1_DERPT|nr:cell division cycle 7-related protein kinase-like [Dermatophagoides pteronyssinus]
MTESIVNKKSSPLFTTTNNNNNQSRNTIVLNGHSNFSSLRIEDPKKAATNNIENDVYVKIMMNNVPQIQQYFNIVDKIGEGTFSKVYKAKLKHCIEMDDNNQNNNGNNQNNNEEYALKYIIPIVKPSRIAKELRFLRDLGGQSNIIPIKTCFYNAGHTIVVMPIVEHDRFQDYLNDLSLTEIRSYMRNLFIALDRVHSHGIIHRDIKPSNFLYNRSNGQFALVDFGLSQNERELYHSINLSLYPYPNKSSMKPTISNHDSKVRKNLCSKFQKNSTKIEDGKLKRSFNEMNQSMIIVDNENVKRKKLDHSQQQTSSVFISPLTPSMMTMKNQDSKSTTSPKSIFVPGTPVKKPFNEHETNIMTTNDTTPVKDQWIYKTPTKTDEMCMVNNEMVLKTPIKTVSSIPETPPKTVQKNLHFSRATPPAPPIINFQLKENINHNYNTPKKLSKPLNYRFQTMKKSLNQELSTSLSNVGNNNNNNVVGGGGGGGNIVDNIHKKSSNQQQQQQRLCDCTQTSTICQNCLSKIELNVPRAGTPGFRAPEILLRYSNQSTKIDIWSCGVIFASLLSGRYPFFRCNDDITCLAEIITILGSTKIKRAANALGKTLTISRRSIPTMDLKKICIKLKKTSTANNDDNDTSSNKWYQAPDSAYNLLERLLDPNPNTRFSAAEALSHPFIIGIEDNQDDNNNDDNESSF